MKENSPNILTVGQLTINSIRNTFLEDVINRNLDILL